MVEFAVCLPLIMILILGSMETTSAIFLRQALTTSAYEGIREACKTSTSTVAATSRARAILDARQVNNATIQFTPSDVGIAPRGSIVTIEVAAPSGSNSPFFGRVLTSRVNTVRTVMIKE